MHVSGAEAERGELLRVEGAIFDFRSDGFDEFFLYAPGVGLRWGELGEGLFVFREDAKGIGCAVPEQGSVFAFDGDEVCGLFFVNGREVHFEGAVIERGVNCGDLEEFGEVHFTPEVVSGDGTAEGVGVGGGGIGSEPALEGFVVYSEGEHVDAAVLAEEAPGRRAFAVEEHAVALVHDDFYGFTHLA